MKTKIKDRCYTEIYFIIIIQMKGLLRLVLVAVFCHVVTYGQQCAAPMINFDDLGFYATQTFEGRESQNIYNEEFANIAKTISV